MKNMQKWKTSFMQQDRRSQTPLIDSFLEPECAFHRRRKKNKEMADQGAEITELRRQLEEMWMSSQAAITLANNNARTAQVRAVELEVEREGLPKTATE